ncbi:MAG: IS66 family transposase [Methylovirgula sp.]|uniref:IS66 family transposase n=1 Tax=Methylovirgula sp. TaxID=1978224 RepID=UPI0030766B64
MTDASDPLPSDLASAHALILAQRELLANEQALRIVAESAAKVGALEIERLKLMLAKARRAQFGQSSERGRLLIEQLELAIEDLEETQAAEATRVEIAAPEAAREKRARGPRGPRKLPDDLPVERIVEPAPCSCGKCGGRRLRKLGEVVSKTLECEPRRWKIVERVREKFSCRDCEGITEAPAPSHPIPRGFAGPSLLAMVLVSKFLLHQPLNRQSDACAREGIEIDTSTLADWVGACVVALDPLVQAIRVHVLRADRIHADDTRVQVLAKLKTITGRLWTYVRDDQPFGGTDPPAAFFEYSRNRAGEHPQRHLVDYVGIMQADAYQGYNELYKLARRPAPILEAACWAHWRRHFFDLAKDGKAPIAIEAVHRMDELFEIERMINGKSPRERLAVRRELSKPLVDSLETWLSEQRARLSAKNDTTKVINYGLSRWTAFTHFLEDGRVCLSNNAAERAVRGIAVGRRNWTFAGSDEGGRRAASVYTLIETCKLNDVDPQAWLTDVLARLPDHPAKEISQLLPWAWKAARQSAQAVAA